MRVLKVARWLLAVIFAAIVVTAGWLYLSPPELIRVGSAYAAKIICSNVVLAGRDARQVLEVDVQAPGHPLLRLMDFSVDREEKTITAGLFGVFGRGTAVARPGYGCTIAPDGRPEAIAPVPDPAPPSPSDALWPEGAAVQPSQDPAIAAILGDEELAGPGMRAVVVVKGGRIVAERYGEGFSADTPLLGWSMTKSVNAAIVGTLVKAGRLSLDRKALLASWNADNRKEISLADLMAMSSGLAFNENYGSVSDVTRMLYLEPDMAGFAAGMPLADEIGRTFNYSSGTANIISRIWQDAAGPDALSWPRKALFDPIGMTSAVFEVDAHGTFVGSSYLYATARDWARFGLFILREGSWNGREILPAGFVGWMREEAPASDGAYGRGQVWLHGPEGGTPPGLDPDVGFDLPDDTFWFEGHDGQSVAVIPSKDIVVVRMGLTPFNLFYRPQGLVAAVAKAVE